jgi:type IV pilus assembly protein PilQ
MRGVLTVAATAAAMHAAAPHVSASAIGASPLIRSLIAEARGTGTRSAETRSAETRSAETRSAETRGAVTGVSVVPADGRAEVVIAVDNSIKVQDFALEAPRRVVLDLSGATLDMVQRPYDRVTRGGVVNVRVSQFRAGVVRVVIELDGAHEYAVSRNGNELRVAVEGGDAQFAAWQAGSARPVAHVAEGSVEAAVRTADALPPEDALNVAPLEAPMAKSAARRTLGGSERPRAAAAAPAPRITVTYQDADIRDVIAAFAAFSGRTIVVGREVEGAITAEIKDQPWDVALQALLSAQGLAASEESSGIITVDSYKNIAANRASEPLVTQIFDVNYAKAASMLPMISGLLSRDCSALGPNAGAQSGGAQGSGCMVRGSANADTSTNKLLVTDVPSRLADIGNRVKELDVRTPQVAIKAKIIFVNRTGIEDIGLSYDLGTGTQQFFNQLVKRLDPSTAKPMDTNGDGVPDGVGGGTAFDGDRVSLGGNALSALSNANSALAPSALNLIYSATLGRFQLTAFLNALQTSQLADVQSEPSIVTLNNRTAEIFVGQQIPIRVIDASAGGGGGGNFPRATVRLEEAGIRLSVTPQVTNNNKVILRLSAENSNAEVSSSDVGLIFNRQRTENQLLVGDGETAVIGGLTVVEKSITKTGIPFLVDLPLIGRLFGQTRTSEVKRDLLILVTPHILDEGEVPNTPDPRRR